MKIKTGQIIPAAAMLALCVGMPTRAAPSTFLLQPPSSEVGYRVYAVGIFPMDAAFGKFQGTVTLDPATPGNCSVDLTVDVNSLTMADPDRRKQALEPDMMDVDHYPTLTFHGHCQSADSIIGDLTMHGVTRQVEMKVSREEGRLITTGKIRRSDFGVNGLPNLLGETIRIRFSTALPQEGKPG
ncbi:MAG TPA: YceI family protein [Acetobacteraceae bacterium]|nr:YceI family protein [Acetobacteraceae bacterium]